MGIPAELLSLGQNIDLATGDSTSLLVVKLGSGQTISCTIVNPDDMKAVLSAMSEVALKTAVHGSGKQASPQEPSYEPPEVQEPPAAQDYNDEGVTVFGGGEEEVEEDTPPPEPVRERKIPRAVPSPPVRRVESDSAGYPRLPISDGRDPNEVLATGTNVDEDGVSSI